jgi:hypothetical protein
LSRCNAASRQRRGAANVHAAARRETERSAPVAQGRRRSHGCLGSHGGAHDHRSPHGTPARRPTVRRPRPQQQRVATQSETQTSEVRRTRAAAECVSSCRLSRRAASRRRPDGRFACNRRAAVSTSFASAPRDAPHCRAPPPPARTACSSPSVELGATSSARAARTETLAAAAARCYAPRAPP